MLYTRMFVKTHEDTASGHKLLLRMQIYRTYTEHQGRLLTEKTAVLLAVMHCCPSGKRTLISFQAGAFFTRLARSWFSSFQQCPRTRGSIGATIWRAFICTQTYFSTSFRTRGSIAGIAWMRGLAIRQVHNHWGTKNFSQCTSWNSPRSTSPFSVLNRWD